MVGPFRRNLRVCTGDTQCLGIVGTGVTSAAISALSLASLLWGLRGWHKD